MSSGTSSKDAASSSAPTRTQSQKEKAEKAKLRLTIEIDGTVVGDNASKWSTRVGDIIWARVPVHYKDWRYVPKNFKDDVWRNLMKYDDPTKTFTRTDRWLMGHEDENGVCVLASAKPLYDQIKDANDKGKSEEGSSTTLENDPVSKVLGKDKRGRVRGMGSHVSKKQMIHLGIAGAKDELNKEEKYRVAAMKDEFKTYISEAIQGAMSTMMAKFNSGIREGSPQMVTTPRS